MVKKLLLCAGILCNLEAYGADTRDIVVDLLEKGLGYLPERIHNDTAESKPDHEVNFINTESGESAPGRLVSDNIIIKNGKKYRKRDYFCSTVMPEVEEEHGDMKTFLADFYEKLINRDPKTVSLAAGTICAIYGLIRIFV